MIRHLAIWVLLAAKLQAAVAQKPDTAQVLVHYKFIHVRDTNNRAHPYTENMVLFVGKAATSYKSYDIQLQNQLFRKQMQEQIDNTADGNIRFDHNTSGSGTEYYQLINSTKLVRKEVLVNSYIINDVLPVINWRISGGKTTIGHLRCQKTTCLFAGRCYTAWFCPDLPLRAGPWKLNGLPGVIVEAYDASKDVIFKFDGVEKAVPGVPKPIKDRRGRIVTPLDEDQADIDPNIIQVPGNGIRTTETEFRKLRNAIIKDPNVLVHSMRAVAQNNGGPKPDININVGPQPINNNPIELPEK